MKKAFFAVMTDSDGNPRRIGQFGAKDAAMFFTNKLGETLNFTKSAHPGLCIWQGPNDVTLQVESDEVSMLDDIIEMVMADPRVETVEIHLKGD